MSSPTRSGSRWASPCRPSTATGGGRSSIPPGPPRTSRDEADKSRLWADQDYLSRVDPLHYAEGRVSDAEGCVTLPALIPGATYRFFDNSEAESVGHHLRKEFVVGPGETIDLGDIVIAKPMD